MVQLEQLIKPTWDAERWLNNAWVLLEPEEQLSIKKRVDDLFFNGLPFQLEHDKLIYIRLFSMLTQLEVFALQALLKPSEILSDPELKLKMRQQILDEVFHATVFAKIAYELSAPYALPPTNNGIDQFMSLLADEPDLRTSVVLINLVGEGWSEEIFLVLKKYKVAPRVIDVILEDESRHLEDYDLYFGVGLPSKDYLNRRLSYLEEIVMSIFSQAKFVESLLNVLGITGTVELANRINKKHHKLLEKINCEPTQKWKNFMRSVVTIIQDVFYNQVSDAPVLQTTTRRILASQWDDPNQPTQSTVFGINVSELGFFEKKHSSETVTCLFLQAISKTLSDNPTLRNYMYHHKIYNPQHAYIGLAVRLPECGDQLGIIEFKDCHAMTVSELSHHIRHDIQTMAYCHKKTEELKVEHPFLVDIFDEIFSKAPADDVYADSLFAKPAISLSNIGHWGYETVISPLLPNETVKFTLGKLERKQVWSSVSKQFEVQDIVPVGMSVDHRVFDANMPVPNIIQAAFNDVQSAMVHHGKSPSSSNGVGLQEFIKYSDALLADDLELGFRYLFFSSLNWKNYGDHKAIAMKKRDATGKALYSIDEC